MKEDKKDMIFLGGALSAEKSIRQKIAPRASRIEELIWKYGYRCSLNMLGNKNVYSHEPKEKHPDFSNGEPFLRIGNRLLQKISKRTIDLVHGLRYFEDEDYFKTSQMAMAIVRSQIEQAFAGIFEMSAGSQGSIHEITLLIEVYERPVLCLNHESFGDRCFPVVLTGNRSPLLKTVKYNDDDLESIIKDFLLIELEKRKMKTFSFMLSMGLYDRAKVRSKQEQISLGKWIRNAIDNNLSNGSIESLKSETDKYINYFNDKMHHAFNNLPTDDTDDD